MATIIRRGETWQAKVRRKGYPPISRTFDTKSDAEKWSRQIEGEMDRGAFVDRREADSTTLDMALERYEREVAPRKKGASPTTVRNDLALISHLFNTAIKEWGLAALGNPVEKIPMPAAARARDRRLDREKDSDGPSEETWLLAACDDGPHWLGQMVRLALATAMRQGELLALDWRNIDLERKVARLQDTKNGDRRDVPLSSEAIKALNGLPGSRTGKVFSIGTMAVVHAFQRACKRTGIDDLRFHDLRHEATTRLFKKGLNPMEAAAVTGHKTLQMLKRYTHLRAEDLAERLG
jgi:integrase